MAANTNTIITVPGTWTSEPSSSTNIEGQLITGTYTEFALPTPPPAATVVVTRDNGLTDPIDDFFGVTRPRGGNTDSRHDVPARPTYAEDMEIDLEAGLAPPPPYADASDLPSYTAVAEPPTLAMYLFKFGFLFPLFWLAGIVVLVSPLSAPENWEPTKTEAERQELIELLRKTERKWAKRCLWAFLILAVVAAIIAGVAVGAMRS